jgi:hypothetical protein
MMSTNKTFLLIAASLLTGAFCAASALAQPSKPDYYQSLSAVEGMNDAQAPAIAGGFYGLSGNERRYAEPLQLSGPSAKIKRAKYEKGGTRHAKYKKVSGKGKRPHGRGAKVRTVKF